MKQLVEVHCSTCGGYDLLLYDLAYDKNGDDSRCHVFKCEDCKSLTGLFSNIAQIQSAEKVLH